MDTVSETDFHSHEVSARTHLTAVGHEAGCLVKALVEVVLKSLSVLLICLLLQLHELASYQVSQDLQRKHVSHNIQVEFFIIVRK